MSEKKLPASKFPIPFFLITAFILLAIGLFLVFYFNCMNKPQFLTTQWILSFSGAFFAACIPGFLHIKIDWLNYSISAGGAIAVLILLYYKTPDVIDQFQSCTEDFSLTIYTHGSRGRHDIVLKNEGRIAIDFKNNRRSEPINEKGGVTFLDVPSEFDGKRLIVSVEAPTYKSKFSDSPILLRRNQPLYIEVIRKNLDMAKGYILDNSNFPVDSVQVSILDLPKVYTNANGYFEIPIPNDKQREQQLILAMKRGYKKFAEESEINSTADLKIILQK